jgi:hypothetical protein
MHLLTFARPGNHTLPKHPSTRGQAGLCRPVPVLLLFHRRLMWIACFQVRMSEAMQSLRLPGWHKYLCGACVRLV